MSRKPTFVFVPGNFLPPSYYANIAKLLETSGFPTRLVTLPSTGSKSPLTSNEPDVAAVRQVLEELSDSGKQIIVVAHSYGSIPACEAIKDLEYEPRSKLGKSGGVVRLVLIAAWLLQGGESPPDIIGRYKIEAPWVRFEVSYSLVFFPPVITTYLADSARVVISSPTIPSTLSTTTQPQTSQPTGLHTRLTPTSPLLQLR